MHSKQNPPLLPDTPHFVLFANAKKKYRWLLTSACIMTTVGGTA